MKSRIYATSLVLICLAFVVAAWFAGCSTTPMVTGAEPPSAQDLPQDSELARNSQIAYPRNTTDMWKRAAGSDEATYEQLQQIVDLSGLSKEMNFGEALDQLRKSVEPPLKLIVNWRDLSDNGDIDQNTAANMEPISGVPLGVALERLLKVVAGGFVDLGYAVESGVVTVATKPSFPQRWQTLVYDVSELIGKPVSQVLPGAHSQIALQDRQADIIELIQETIEPDSWFDNGGEGTISFYEGRKLIVRQTPEVHRQIDQMLRDMRKALGQEGSNTPRDGIELSYGNGYILGQTGGQGGGYGGYGGGMGGYGGYGGGYGGGGYGGGAYGDGIGYARNWKELNSIVAGTEGVNRTVPVLGDVPIRGRMFSNSDAVVRPRDSRLAEILSEGVDELWVIAKLKGEVVGSEDVPGCGAMLCRLPEKEEEVPLPLKHTDVSGRIAGYIATVEVTQQFHNPYSEKIEARYVFPLPQNAAVNEFIMTIGERKIRGIIREREEAERIYQQARSQGHVASLLTQERPNIFTQNVANIEPGKEIDINIKYFNTLAYMDGWYEFVFPMVVGPRFNPPGFTDGVGAVARGKAGISGQKTEVQYLKPGERSGHDISVAVDIDAGVAIEEVLCSSHAVTKEFDGKEKVSVVLSDLDSIPNKDFVLRYKVAGRRVKSALVTHRDQRGGFFTLMLYPPEDLRTLERSPMEMIFVLDCSGSMRGKPIAKAKDAIKRALRMLGPDDTFQVIRFSNNASQLGPKPVVATKENVEEALRYVDSLEGSGGTMMIEGIKAALDFEHDAERFRLVSFMTDGYIGNETQILAAIHQKLGASRIFSFGVGTSVNRYLLDRMAQFGKGAVAYIGLDESAGAVVDDFYERISHPALTDVEVDFSGMDVSDVYPARIPDLFVGRPVILTGRFNGDGPTTVTVKGKAGGKKQTMEIAADLDAGANHPGIASVWARKRIEVLANRMAYSGNPDMPAEIKQVALEYSLMSAYTAFVAVDSSRVTTGDHGVSVAVPVPVPEGVRYDTTVRN